MPPLFTETVYDDLNPTAAPTAREQWGIMVIATAGKVLSGTDRKEGGKDVNGISPHKYAGQCTIGALAIYIHWQYDEYDQRRNSHVKPTFFTRAIAEMNTKLGREAGVQPIDWFDDSTLRQTRLCSSGESNTIVPPSHAVARAGFVVYKWVGRLFSSKVMHYARSAQTRILEQELGCPAADVKRIGHWVVKTCDVVYLCKTPAKLLRGSAQGEPYIVPRLSIRPPEDLQRIIFPWLDEPNLAAALDHERHVAPDGRTMSKDTAAHLLGLRKLRSFLLLHLAEVYRHAPESPLFVELPLFRNEGGTEALAWICDEYPTLIKEALSLVKKDPQVLKHAADQKEAKLRRDVATQLQETQYHAAVERRADREGIKADVKMHMDMHTDSIDTKLDAVLKALTGGPFSGRSSSSAEAASTSGPLAGVVQPTPGASITIPSTLAGADGVEAPSLLNNVVYPNKLWLVYRPKDMAAYKTIQEIVDDWEAERLIGNEKLPPLSMIDELFPQFETEMRVVVNYYKVKNNLVPPSPPRSTRSSQEAVVKES
ncbi:hypothetical protein MVLG_06738 [Microbotryum lychnidis-dioicae p1A1 Lamole]|uniref:Ndc10 domain-containing protein n=1 Tax=Microbotryum lychnidis-dioicae (strain p1A1 Lamole / MvSl-1064) TaxID=683840 RepID=U5HI72_USTV1|nr:hypothetical protein MVLG_06738 [Microbotryum lychnidis-dioicae p1A1 Lamole]|eukprot:KDE02723.1 hypothetical protein MVLG_06738 [Microbotryum lychnidis-dioicae p1A1 Lamole]